MGEYVREKVGGVVGGVKEKIGGGGRAAGGRARGRAAGFLH